MYDTQTGQLIVSIELTSSKLYKSQIHMRRSANPINYKHAHMYVLSFKLYFAWLTLPYNGISKPSVNHSSKANAQNPVTAQWNIVARCVLLNLCPFNKRGSNLCALLDVQSAQVENMYTSKNKSNNRIENEEKTWIKRNQKQIKWNTQYNKSEKHKKTTSQ